MQELFTKQNPEEKSSDYLTSADVTEEYKDAIERVRAKAREKAKAPGSIVLQAGVVPPEKLDREELLTWEERISAPNRGIIQTSDFSEPSEIYLELIHRIRRYHPNTDIEIIDRAYNFAKNNHGDQKRKSGEPYIIHPLCVALILSDLEMDKETIAAGLLHDTVEDTEATIDAVKKYFGEEVALLVDGVTKLGEIKYEQDKVISQAENLRKMFLAMSKDIRVIIIKLADRLHNMRTLRFMTPEKQKEKARETQEIYAPLAMRLGISKMKVELDDLALKYLEPEAYYTLVEAITRQKMERDTYVDSLEAEVKQAIEEAGIKAEVNGRAKHFFSIYKKMVNQKKTLDQIYDLFAIRIIVKDVKDCYAALGVMHEKYTPIPGRFKDYIAMPKPNMYQSLHTTLIGPDGTPFEIQIRTEEMHRTAEYGVAAHWKYKESGEGASVAGEEQKLSWLRQILEWQQDMSDDREFMSLLKSDLNLFSDTVFCFTPQGDVKNLPKGSTPIDFAYAIHSGVGNTMVGAKVNGRMVPIDYEIANGDRVDIITSQNSKGPSRDWLNVVKSTQAKNKINQWFRALYKDDDIAKGRDFLLQAAKQKGLSPAVLADPRYQRSVLDKYGQKDWEHLLQSIGNSNIKEGAVVNKILSDYLHDHPKNVTDEEILSEHKVSEATSKFLKDPTASRQGKHGIVVNGIGDLSVRFSRCCDPLPGDEIVGFITRGRGITIHRTDCVNILNLPELDRERLIDAAWREDILEGEKKELYKASLKIYGKNRTGLLVDISRVFTESNIDIRMMQSRVAKTGTATIEVSFGAKSTDELRAISEKLRSVEGVLDIERTAS